MSCSNNPRSCHVAVIGAGVSGLSTARELLGEGHSVTVFEKSNRVGGTWVYDSQTDSDPLSLDPTRNTVHGSLYRSLRTNLPRPLMGFTDYSLTGRDYGDSREFPGHEEVLSFLGDFAREFGVVERIRFGVEVVEVRMGAKKDEWVVKFASAAGDEEEEVVEGKKRVVKAEVFQAVVVCNGHCTEPRVADNIPGIDRWPNKQIHSHNYRIPDPFHDQVVVVIGWGPSAFDISRDISKVAKEVHLSTRSTYVNIAKLDGHTNIWQHPKINFAHENGMIRFDDGSAVFVDAIVHCTGYKYCFPFLESSGVVGIDDNCVGPLYKHVFPPQFAPWLAFVGLNNKSRWVAKVLSGKVGLPSEEKMNICVRELYAQLEERNTPKHLTHDLYPKEDDYLNWLAALTGLPPIEDWMISMHRTVRMKLSSHDDSFRDKWGAICWDK